MEMAAEIRSTEKQVSSFNLKPKTSVPKLTFFCRSYVNSFSGTRTEDGRQRTTSTTLAQNGEEPDSSPETRSLCKEGRHHQTGRSVITLI